MEEYLKKKIHLEQNQQKMAIDDQKRQYCKGYTRRSAAWRFIGELKTPK
jgi:hypothetical protein